MGYTAKFVKNGNIKVGSSIWTFNKLAGAGEINGCKGTCGKHCTGCYNAENPKKSSCYVFKGYVLYGWEKSTVVNSHIRNTNFMRANEWKAFEELREQLERARNKPCAVRIHAAGEIETWTELFLWIETARLHPEIPFYVYTKAFECLDQTLEWYEKNKRSVPSNFFINISVWHKEGIDEYKKWRHLDCIRAFVYADKNFDYSSYLKPDCYCPAYNEKGKLDHNYTCDKCKICFQKKAKICFCYEH